MRTFVLVPGADLPAEQLGDLEIGQAAIALQQWLNHEVAPAWSQGSYLVVPASRGGPAPAGDEYRWLVHLVGEGDAPGVLGYHYANGGGHPEAKVFAGLCLRIGYPWWTVLAHEAAEMAGNRFVDEAISASYQGELAFYTRELCDPVEGLQYPFQALGKGWPAPDFVTPSYFRPGQPGPYDRLGACTAPLLPAPGGRQSATVVMAPRQVTIGPAGLHTGGMGAPAHPGIRVPAS